MEVTKEHIYYILLYEFNKGNAMKSAENIEAVYGDQTISVSQCDSRNFELETTA